MVLSAEMCHFIVENAVPIQSAYTTLEEADALLSANMYKFTKRVLEDDDVFHILPEEEGIGFSSPKWKKNEKGELLMSIWLDCHGENSDQSWITVLGGKAPGAVAGLYCWYDWGAEGIKRKEWKNLVRDFFATHDSLHENGFILNDQGAAIIRPFTLDPECLKDNFLAPDKCFEPLAEAIEAFHSQIKVFDELEKQVRQITPKIR